MAKPKKTGKPSRKAAAVRTSDSTQRHFAQSKDLGPALIINNCGDSSIRVEVRGTPAVDLKPGASHALRPELLELQGGARTSAPMEIASRSVILAGISAPAAAGRVSLDTSSLRAQAAIYGVPELLLLRDKNSSCIMSAAATLDLPAGGDLLLLLVGRGPVLNLGLAMRALFPKPQPEAAEKK